MKPEKFVVKTYDGNNWIDLAEFWKESDAILFANAKKKAEKGVEMNLKDILPDFELCKELSQYFHDAMCWWVKETSDSSHVLRNFKASSIFGSIPAPTSEEILEVLPKAIVFMDFRRTIRISNNDGNYIVGYYAGGLTPIQFYDKKLSNALMKLLKWCIDNGYVEVRKCQN